MTRVRIYPNQLDSQDFTQMRVKDALETFKIIKKKHPQARVFLRPACSQNDITPTDQKSLERFKLLASYNELDIVCCAGDPMTVAVVSLVVSAGMALYTYLNMPDMDAPTRGSPNNELANRTNRERINGRVPDIMGRDKSIPDLIAPPFEYYENNIAVEENLMCAGRGYYDIQEVQDGNTPLGAIEGSAASFYDPGTNITGTPALQIGETFTHKPPLAVRSSSVNGQSLEQPNEVMLEGGVYFTSGGIIHSTSSNFASLFAVNDRVSINYAEFVAQGLITSGAVNFNQYDQLVFTRPVDILGIDAFKTVTITGATAYKDITVTNAETLEEEIQRIYFDLSGTYSISAATKTTSGSNFIYTLTLDNPESVNPSWTHIDSEKSLNVGVELLNSSNVMDLDGYYTVASVTSTSLELTNASSINSDWLKLPTFNNGSTLGLPTDTPIQIEKLNNKWVGWFEGKLDSAEKCVFNIIMPNGISNVTNKGKFTHAWLELQVQCEAYDEDNVKIGPTISETLFLQFATRDQIARTISIDLPAGTHRVRFRAAKVRAETRNSPVTEAKLKSVFLVKDMDKLVYENVTIVRSKTIATTGALSLKERELNAELTSKLYSYSTGEKSITRVATTRFSDIVCHLHTDPLIGRRDISTLDVEGLYSTQSEIEDYFGTPQATEFNYTFDQSNFSYEESLAQIASCVFSNARREGSKFHFRFEKLNPHSAILFNHANKKPFTETRSRKWGKNREFDGVEITWKDPDNEWIEKTVKIPNDLISNPKKIELNGVTNKFQAHFIGHRAWNKMRHHKRTVSFTAYGEADLVTINDRISVTDDRKLYKMLNNLDFGLLSGEIVEWDLQTIRVSIPTNLDPNLSYTIHIQHINRSVETMSVTQGNDECELILGRLPIMPLIAADQKEEGAKYSITLDTEVESEAFLIMEKSNSGYLESSITAMNYDSRYYLNDFDHINNLI